MTADVLDPAGLRHRVLIDKTGIWGAENLGHVVHESIGDSDVRTALARQVVHAIQQGVARIDTAHGTFFAQPV